MAFEVRVVDKDKQPISVTIFRNEGKYGPMYRTGVSYKKQDGAYKTSYIDLFFGDGVELENKSRIHIYEATLTPTNDQGKVALRVWKWDYDNSIKREENLTSQMSGGFQQVNDGLPF